jgi:hypothetical protein
MNCLICNKEVSNLGTHLVLHKVSSEDYYTTHVLKDIKPVCGNPDCGCNTKFISISYGYRAFCSRKCSNTAKWNDEYKHKLSNSLSKSWTDKRKLGFSKQMSAHYNDPAYLATHIENCKRSFNNLTTEQRDKFVSNNRGKHGYHESIKAGRIMYRSTYELVAYQILDSLSKVLTYKSEPFRIPYLLDGVEHTYIPDILVTYTDRTLELIEIKPERQVSETSVQAKSLAAINFCDNLGIPYTIWTEKELRI